MEVKEDSILPRGSISSSPQSPEDSSLPRQANADQDPQPQKQMRIWHRFWNLITWTPPRCRWNPESPPKFSMSLNLLFGFAAMFTVANLYYNHPLLVILAHDFNVDYEQVSQIPTVMQAGYAAGLLFLCPLGDLVKRRPFVLGLIFLTACLWIVLCLTKSFPTFIAISFLVGATTTTPQLMLPLVGDLAPPNRRAAALSIVTSGLIGGILIARVLSGIVANYTSWRNVYWMSLGLQYVICFLLWLYMPDYPSVNPSGLGYFRILWTILVMVTKHAVLVQACLVAFFTAATFTNFWTTLTGLLSGDPYHYSTLVIGLFALIALGAIACGPLYARLVTDRFVPLFSVIAGELVCLVGIVLGTYLGKITVAGPILQALLNDLGLQTAQIANRSAIYSVEPRGRNRVNTAFMVSVFAGQLCGTAIGNSVYANHGWVASGSVSVGFIGIALCFCAARGPWETGWVGWKGGWNFKKKNALSADGITAEVDVYKRNETGDVEQPTVTGEVSTEHEESSTQDEVPDTEKTALEEEEKQSVDDRAKD